MKLPRYILILPLAAIFAIGPLVPAHPAWAAPKKSAQLTEDADHLDKVRLSPIPPLLSPEPIPQRSQMRTMSTFSVQSTEGVNLISNASLESGNASGTLPVDWIKGGYGTNTRTLAYPVTGFSGKAARVTISSYASGDAKWAFKGVGVQGGATYAFSDYYAADIASIVTADFTLADGTHAYKDFLFPGPSAAFARASGSFTAPANAVSVTVYHLIKGVGTLTTDEYSLTQTSSPPPPPPPPEATNYVPNGNLENTNASGLPVSWGKGRSGTNTAVYSYPVNAIDGTKAAKVEITGYTTGDAKWYFAPVSLPAGVYTYSDQFVATKNTVITVQYLNANGSYSYRDIAIVPAASAPSSVSVDFNVPSGTQSVTVFHLIQGVGSLTLDNVAVKKKASAGIYSTGAVTLRFDDGWLSQYEAALPKLQSAGLKASFYIVPKYFAENGFPGYMSTAQIQDMYAKGHEIGAHTRTHRDLVTLSAAEQESEISGSRQDLAALGVGSVSSFSYPFGSYDATTLSIVKKAGYTSALSTINGYATAASDPYQLERQLVTVDTTLEQMKAWVDAAIANRTWLILELHEVSDNGRLYSITPANFSALVDYLKQKNARVVTVTQGISSQ